MNDEAFTATREKTIATIGAATDSAGNTISEGVEVTLWREITITDAGSERVEVVSIEPATGRGDVTITAAQIPQLVTALWRAREAAEQHQR